MVLAQNRQQNFLGEFKTSGILYIRCILCACMHIYHNFFWFSLETDLIFVIMITRNISITYILFPWKYILIMNYLNKIIALNNGKKNWCQEIC